MMAALALLLLPVAAACLALSSGFRGSPLMSGAMRAPLALGLGTAVSAAAFGAWLLAGLAPAPGYVAVESAVLGVVLLALLAQRRRAAGPTRPAARRAVLPPPRLRRRERLLLGAFTVAAALDLVAFAVASRAEPHGGWDAWAIWNLKARFILHGGDQWRNLFSPLLPHPDYPLLLPWTVSRLWLGAGDGSPLAPILVALAFTAATVVLLVAAVAAAAGRRRALVAGLLLTTTFGFVMQGASQYADVPLGFYFLATVVCLSMSGAEPARAKAWAACAGALGGAAALTKNEGVLFLAAAAVGALAAWRWRAPLPVAARRLLAFVAGALPFVTVLAFCKITGAWENDLLHGTDWSSLSTRALDPQRHLQVAGGLLSAAAKMGTPLLAPFAAVTLGGARRGGAAGAITVTLVAAGYYAILLATPHDLAWHVSTAADRLVMQLWPAALFLAFGTASPPAPDGEPGVARGPRGGPGRGRPKAEAGSA